MCSFKVYSFMNFDELTHSCITTITIKIQNVSLTLKKLSHARCSQSLPTPLGPATARLFSALIFCLF